ncbi:hypothetical protein FGO68_gene14862 [Halteria grandinella]|uniref:Potassium channel domain-containing protein n=1 Tax=Halteria grandinella TaxID=5974 RepID=A0A8J8P4R7_HALGN|nr:hypothetical protein FGO68_gene14862 [Halteria grandinella]
MFQSGFQRSIHWNREDDAMDNDPDFELEEYKNDRLMASYAFSQSMMKPRNQSYITQGPLSPSKGARTKFQRQRTNKSISNNLRSQVIMNKRERVKEMRELGYADNETSHRMGLIMATEQDRLGTARNMASTTKMMLNDVRVVNIDPGEDEEFGDTTFEEDDPRQRSSHLMVSGNLAAQPSSTALDQRASGTQDNSPHLKPPQQEGGLSAKQLKKKRSVNRLTRDKLVMQEVGKLMYQQNQGGSQYQGGNINSAIFKFQRQDSMTSQKIQQQTVKSLRVQDQYYDWWRAFDLVGALVALAGLAVAIYSHECELTYDFEQIESRRREGLLPLNDFEPLVNDSNSEIHIYRLVTTVLTLFSMAIFVLRHIFIAKWRQQQYKFQLVESIMKPVDFNKQKEMKKLSGSSFLRSYTFYIDMCLLIIHPIPFVDPTFDMVCVNNMDKTKFVTVKYRMSTVLLTLMFTRIILIVRAALNYSAYTDQHAKRLLSDNYGFSPDVRFTLKCMIQRRPEATVSLILATSVLVIAYLLRLYEIMYYRAIGYLDFEQFIAAVWTTVITMATVGYGDVIPGTHIGRLIMMVTSIWGTFIFTLVIVAFGAVFNLSPHQKKAMHHLLLTRKAASTLTSAFRYYNSKKQFRTKNQSNPLYKEILQRKISFTNLDKDLKIKKITLSSNINDFRDERIALKRLKVNDGNETRKDLFFIKGEILDMSRDFHNIYAGIIDQKQIQEHQNEMLMGIQIDQRAIRAEQIEQQRAINSQQKRIKHVVAMIRGILKASKIDFADSHYEANYVSSTSSLTEDKNVQSSEAPEGVSQMQSPNQSQRTRLMNDLDIGGSGDDATTNNQDQSRLHPDRYTNGYNKQDYGFSQFRHADSPSNTVTTGGLH